MAHEFRVKNGLILPLGTNINEFSIDGTMVGDSDTAVPTEKAVRTYVASAIGSPQWSLISGYLKPATDGVDIRVFDTGGTDYIELSHDATNAQFIWNDGYLNFATVEATTASAVRVTGSGAAGASFRLIYGNDASANTEFSQGASTFDVVYQAATSSNTAYRINRLSLQDVDWQVYGTSTTPIIHADATTKGVGLGTATPYAKLDIKQLDNTFVGGLQLRNSGSNDTWAIAQGNDLGLYIGYANNASGGDAAGDFATFISVSNSSAFSHDLTVGGSHAITFASTSAYPSGLGPTTPPFSVTNTQSNDGQVGIYVGPDAAGGSVTFAMNPTFGAGGQITGGSSEYPTTGRGA